MHTFYSPAIPYEFIIGQLLLFLYLCKKLKRSGRISFSFSIRAVSVGIFHIALGAKQTIVFYL